MNQTGPCSKCRGGNRFNICAKYPCECPCHRCAECHSNLCTCHMMGATSEWKFPPEHMLWQNDEPHHSVAAVRFSDGKLYCAYDCLVGPNEFDRQKWHDAIPREPLEISAGTTIMEHLSVLLARRVAGGKPRANDVQVGGDHYRKFGGLQPWDLARLWNLDFFQMSVIKYVVRHRDKNRVEDLRKARHYLDKYIEEEKKR